MQNAATIGNLSFINRLIANTRIKAVGIPNIRDLSM